MGITRTRIADSVSTSIAVVAAVNFRLGNVLAPVFAFADTVFVAAVLRHVWRQGERCERIVVAERTLEVHRAEGGPPVFLPTALRRSCRSSGSVPRRH